jgi:hypothetical protein
MRPTAGICVSEQFRCLVRPPLPVSRACPSPLNRAAGSFYMASVLDMLGRLTDQGICLADLQHSDLCAYPAADGAHAMLRSWYRAHAMGLSKGHVTTYTHQPAYSDPAVADAKYLDSVDWVADDCQCCNGGHTRRAGFMFKQWLQQLRDVEGVKEWTPHALAVLQVPF